MRVTRSGQRRPKDLRIRPLLEALEDRWLPSSFMVMNNSDSTPGSLRDAINYANNNPGTTISFAPTVTGTIDLNSELDITASTEIDGPGSGTLTISGQNASEVFNCGGAGPASVTINGLTIANGRRNRQGGGISAVDGNLNLSGDVFLSNQAGHRGGALFLLSETATIAGCVFNSNSVTAPDFSTDPVAGGAIFSLQSTLSVTNSTFTHNAVTGANRATGDLSHSNVGMAAGGAVYSLMDSMDTFNFDDFLNNQVQGGVNDVGPSSTLGIYTVGQGQGGAIDVLGSQVTISQGLFSNNSAIGGRGADGVGSAGGIIGCGLGGAIEVETAVGLSGANGTSVTVDSTSNFSNNLAQGASRGSAATGSVSNAAFGGAIDDEGSDTSLQVGSGVAGGGGCIFSANTAQAGLSGFTTASGGIFGSEAGGGAIFLGSQASGNISATFTGNTAIGANGKGDGSGGNAIGGAIAAFPTNLTISYSQFNRNSALGGQGGSQDGSGGGALGGAVYIDGNVGDRNSLHDLQFTGNMAIGGAGFGTGAQGGNASGGALFLNDAFVVLQFLTMQSNSATGGSGAQGAKGGNGEGGGIAAVGNTSCALLDSTVTQNNASGGIASGGGSNGSAFGGGILISLNSNLGNGGSTITGNTPDNIEVQ
jgi:hypothetical protein